MADSSRNGHALNEKVEKTPVLYASVAKLKSHFSPHIAKKSSLRLKKIASNEAVHLLKDHTLYSNNTRLINIWTLHPIQCFVQKKKKKKTYILYPWHSRG